MLRITALAVAIWAAMIWAENKAFAQFERTHIKGVGETSGIINWSLLEGPLWNETIPAASGGEITGDVIPFDQLGIDNATILRLLRQGAFDYGTTDLGRLAADDPRFEGCDIAGLALGIDEVRAACDAYRPVLERLLDEQWNVKLLYIGIAQPQVFWCRDPVETADDLRGKRIRVFTRSMVDYVDAVGATGVSMAFPEVVPALERGVIDCGVTGSLSGNTGGWGEVTSHVYPVALGWAVRFSAMNNDSWERFKPEVQQFFLDQFAEYEREVWTTMRQAVEEAENCNRGEEPCELGNLLDLTVTELSADEVEAHRDLFNSAVLPQWGARCGSACVVEWNETVGEALGIEAPVN